jgi:hypothetical protein
LSSAACASGILKLMPDRGIMRRYQARAWEINRDLDLEDACGGNGPVLNRNI